jgi:flavin-dependent dehydrogenase
VLEVDVVIIGAGPAGATAGLVLAPHARVLLVDRTPPSARIGESLIPAARRLLRDLGLLAAFEREQHPAYLGNRSHWNGTVDETDFLRDPDGPGWHLDRARFETFLRDRASARGCRLVVPARVETLAEHPRGWSLRLSEGHGSLDVVCRVVIDATGRAAAVTKQLGARREHADRLVARWLRGQVAREHASTAGFSQVVSAEQGWWYTAPLTGGERVLAWHSDADLMPARESAAELLARARATTGLAELLDDTGFVADAPVHVGAANGVVTQPVGCQHDARGWLAVGDAALAFDPLSSRGVFNALYTGLAGAFAASRMIAGERNALSDYAQQLERVRTTYVHHLARCYTAETRWPESPFWSRRRAAG